MSIKLAGVFLAFAVLSASALHAAENDENSGGIQPYIKVKPNPPSGHKAGKAHHPRPLKPSKSKPRPAKTEHTP
jgi:hypothetical protein